MNEGIKKQIKAQIKKLEDFLTVNQDDMSQEEIDEILDKLDELYELYLLFE